jgi:hypothetical protein
MLLWLNSGSTAAFSVVPHGWMCCTEQGRLNKNVNPFSDEDHAGQYRRECLICLGEESTQLLLRQRQITKGISKWVCGFFLLRAGYPAQRYF